MALIDREISSLKPRAKRYEVSDGQHGLVVRVAPTGDKTLGVWWRIPKQYGGPELKGFITLGVYQPGKLADARARAAHIADLASKGIDPRGEIRREAEERRQAQAAHDLTVLRVVERHLDARRAELKPNTWEQYQWTLAILRDSDLAGRQLTEVKKGEVKAALRLVYRERGPGCARKVRTLVRGAARWAAEEDLVAHDVLAGLNFNEVEPKVRDRVLSDDEIVTLWKACDGAPPIIAASVRLQLVLALRHPSETTGMLWTDLKQAVVEIRKGDTVTQESVLVYDMPASRRKHNIPLMLPVPPLGVRILDDMRTMTGNRKAVLDGWTQGKELYWWRRGLKHKLPDVTRHDLRRSAASGMLRLGVPASTADCVLGHVVKGSAKNYLHGARLVEAASGLWRWNDHLERLLGLEDGKGTVVTFTPRPQRGRRSA